MDISLNKKYVFPLRDAAELIFYRIAIILCYATIIATVLLRLPTATIIATFYGLPFSIYFLINIFIRVHAASQLYTIKDYSLVKRLILMLFIPIAEIKSIKRKNKGPVEVYSFWQNLPLYYVDYEEECHLPPNLIDSLFHLFNDYKKPECFVMNEECLANIIATLVKEGYKATRHSETEIVIDSESTTYYIVFSFKDFVVTDNEKTLFKHEYKYIEDDKSSSKKIVINLLPILKEVI